MTADLIMIALAGAGMGLSGAALALEFNLLRRTTAAEARQRRTALQLFASLAKAPG